MSNVKPQILFKSWLVAQIKPNSYNLATRNLERQGFEVFLPKMETTIKIRNKLIYKKVFVFPGYMFVGFDIQNFNWNKINNTYGVSKVLIFNNKPSEVSHNLILALKHTYESNMTQISKESLQKGDTIKFINGPFVDFLARIENMEKKDRIWVLLDFIGGSTKLELKYKGNTSYFKV